MNLADAMEEIARLRAENVRLREIESNVDKVTADWSRRCQELEDERDIFKRTLDKRDKQYDEKLSHNIRLLANSHKLWEENERLKGAIPAYEPPPCDCCIQRGKYHLSECYCGNLGHHEDACRWCERMDIIDSFEEAMKDEE